MTIHLDSNNLNDLLHDFLTVNHVNARFFGQPTTPCNPLEVARLSSWVTPARAQPKACAHPLHDHWGAWGPS